MEHSREGTVGGRSPSDQHAQLSTDKRTKVHEYTYMKEVIYALASSDVRTEVDGRRGVASVAGETLGTPRIELLS